MRLFYHAFLQKNIRGYLQVSIWFLILVIALLIVSNKFVNWKQYIKKLTNGGNSKVDISSLISYSNFYRDKYICTEGIHVKSSTFNILKADLGTDQFKSSIWMEYKEGKEGKFDTYIKNGYAAKVAVCGEFESGRGLSFGNPAVYNHQITVDEYELLENPQLHNI